LKFSAKLLGIFIEIDSSRCTSFGLDDIIFDDIGHFILITALYIGLIIYLRDGFVFSFMDIKIDFSLCIAGMIGDFRLNWRLLVEIVAHRFTASLFLVS
jgi:hypothetical protein